MKKPNQVPSLGFCNIVKIPNDTSSPRTELGF